jgi:very-short-patch-repair endonuclease
MKCNPGEGQGNEGPQIIRFARQLRVDQTDAEKALWNRIRNRQLDGHKFVRQVPVGHYICDFVCRESQLVIEVDGSQRNSRSSLESYRVIRFWNNDVLGNIEGVLLTIQTELRG